MFFDAIRSAAHHLRHRDDTPVGTWERVGDRFAGCTLVVEATEEGWQGRLASLPAGMSQFGWRVGDLKWRGIQRIRWQTYAAEDLHKQVDPETFELLGSHYRPAQISLVSPSELVAASGAAPATHWRRLAGVGG